jgi:hypothetical protein
MRLVFCRRSLEIEFPPTGMFLFVAIFSGLENVRVIEFRLRFVLVGAKSRFLGYVQGQAVVEFGSSFLIASCG